MAIFWLVLIIVFLVIEAVSFNLVTIWFAVGALGAFITSYFTNDVIIQVIIFSIVTALSLLSTRPIVKKYIGFTPIKTNLDAVVGKIGIITKKIEFNEFGRVKIEGKEWTAKSDVPIEEGTKVEILGIDGVKLVVKEKEEK